MTKLPRFWYSVISALPDPEGGERVNVALVLGGERWARVEIIDDLPKLACLVSRDSLAVFRDALHGIARTVTAPEQFFGLAARIGPHFDLTPPRELFEAPEGRIARFLTNRFLRLEHGERPKRSRHSVQTQASARLDVSLARLLPAGAIVERTATVERLYPELPISQVFKAPVPRLNRAVRVGETDVLIGSVVVDSTDNPLGAARDASARISQAFWQYCESRERLQEITGRTVRTLGVVLNGSSQEREEVRTAKEYVCHLWEGDADLVLAPERREDEALLSSRIESMIENP